MTYHRPVLAQAAVEALVTEPGGTYVDATFGGGGIAGLSWSGSPQKGASWASTKTPKRPSLS
jgi:16S rRNA C1402 N4-methylase RsmH